MSRLKEHPENHLVDRIGWLRAAVLGANDGIVSTASLIVGVCRSICTAQRNSCYGRSRIGCGRDVHGSR